MGVTSESTKRERKKYKTEIRKSTERKEKRKKKSTRVCLHEWSKVVSWKREREREREREKERDWGNPLVIKGFEASERKTSFAGGRQKRKKISLDVLVIRVFQKGRTWIEVLILKYCFTFRAIFQFSLVILKPKSMVWKLNKKLVNKDHLADAFVFVWCAMPISVVKITDTHLQ
jgi:hypothetical protein